MGNPFGGAVGSSQNSSQGNSSQNSANNSSTNSSTKSSSGQSGGQSPQSTQSGGTTGPSMVVFNIGVKGEVDRLVLTGSWLPKDLTRIQEGQTQTSDLRRVVYWLVKDGNKKGLARQEVTAVTGADAGNLPPEVPDQASFIIAPEVTKFSLEYYDGKEWQTSWDGTELTSSLPIGPPALIAINITIATPPHRAGEKAKETSMRHVLAIPSANVTASAAP